MKNLKIKIRVLGTEIPASEYTKLPSHISINPLIIYPKIINTVSFFFIDNDRLFRRIIYGKRRVVALYLRTIYILVYHFLFFFFLRFRFTSINTDMDHI